MRPALVKHLTFPKDLIYPKQPAFNDSNDQIHLNYHLLLIGIYQRLFFDGKEYSAIVRCGQH